MKLNMKELEQSVWNVRTADLPKSEAIPLFIKRVVFLTCKNFLKNKCALRASSLTFLTLMSIVPVVALILGISRGFSFEEKLREKLMESFVGQEQVVEQILEFADAALKVASGGIVTGIGVGMLFFTALKLLANIENSFNDIWGIKRGRTLLRKLSDYITLLLLCPVLAVALIGISAMGVARIEGVLGLPGKGILLSTFRYVSPFLLAWVSFFFLYLFIPHTRVKPRAAIAGAILTGTLFIIIQYIYMFLQTILTGYSAIYGSLAALPFFLIWLQASWTVILLGAQLAFAVQNVNDYEYYSEEQPLCMYYRSLCALRIMKLLGEAFNDRAGAVTATDISSRLEIPIHITRDMLEDLIAAELVIEVAGERRGEDAYVTRVPLEDFVPTKILERLFHIGDDGYSSGDVAEAEALLKSIWSAAEASPANTQLVKAKPEKTDSVSAGSDPVPGKTDGKAGPDQTKQEKGSPKKK